MKRKNKLSLAIVSIFLVGAIAVLAIPSLNPAAETVSINSPLTIAEGPWQFEGAVLELPKYSEILSGVWDSFEVEFTCISDEGMPVSGWEIQLRVAIWENGWDHALEAGDFEFRVDCTGGFDSGSHPGYLTIGTVTAAAVQGTLLNGNPATEDFLELIDTATYSIIHQLAPQKAIAYKVWFKLTDTGYARLTTLPDWDLNGDLNLNAVLLLVP